MLNLSRVKKAPGVYLMLDLDNKPVYAGKADEMLKRLKQHLVSQKSEVVTDGLLDVYEVRSVLIWYQNVPFTLPFGNDDENQGDMLAKRRSLVEMEAALIRDYTPRWNRSRSNHNGPITSLTMMNRDDLIELVDGEELRTRKEALQRIETKLIHLIKAIRKARISGMTVEVRKALSVHGNELKGFCDSLYPRGNRTVQRQDNHDHGLFP